MDVSAYLDLNPAPHVVFQSLETRRSRVRFMLPTDDGDWRAITWGAFADDVRKVAMYMASAGLKSGQRVAVLGHNSVPWFACALGAQAIGGVMVPIYPSSTADQIGYVVEHSDAAIVCVGDEALLGRLIARWDALTDVKRIILLGDDFDLGRVFDRLRAQGKATPPVEAVLARLIGWQGALEQGAVMDAANPQRFEHLMDAVSLDQGAVMLYTSGTTGPPKGVPLTHRNIGTNGRDWLQCNAPLLDEGAVDLFWLPLSHIFGFGQLCLGNTLGFVTYWSNPMEVLGDLPRVRPNVFMSVPRYFEKLATMARVEEGTAAQQEARFNAVTGGQLRFCLSGGAGLKQEVKQFFFERDVLIIEGYGLTEASPTLTLNRPGDFRFDAVGKALPSVQIKLAEDGEILAKGPNIFSGYHKNPEATQKTFTEDGWLLTGDIGRWTEDGFLQIIDRKKEILVTAGGKNIPPANIEMQFQDDPWIAHVVVYGDGKKFISAGIWVHQHAVDAHLDEQGVEGDAARLEARQQLIQRRVEQTNAQLAKHETIRKFAIIDEPLTIEGGLLTPTLKIKRKKIYERFRDQFESMYGE